MPPKKNKDEAKSEPAETAASSLATARSLFRPQWLLATALLISAFVFGPRFAQSLPDLNERPEYRVRVADIQVSPEPPRWIPVDFVALALEDAGLPRELSLLDPQLVGNVAAAFQRHPWVAEVVQVKKGSPASLSVELKYRQPIAVVEVPEGLYPIDRFGVLLPPADLAPSEARRFPLIQNVDSLPSGPAGTAWGDVCVTGAARLAAELLETVIDGDPAWKRFSLVALRVPRRVAANATLDDVLLELSSAGGSRILWGRPPGTNHPGELAVDQKLGRLEKYVRDYGGFDQPHGPYEIDIRHWQEISRRSLAGVPRTRH